MSQVRTYMRPMAGWWRKNPYFVRYMIREASAPLFYAYALWLLMGLVALARGEAAYNAWRAASSHPLSILLHAKIGTTVGRGDALATIAFDDPARERAARPLIERAFAVGQARSRRRPLVLETLGS